MTFVFPANGKNSNSAVYRQALCAEISRFVFVVNERFFPYFSGIYLRIRLYGNKMKGKPAFDFCRITPGLISLLFIDRRPLHEERPNFASPLFIQSFLEQQRKMNILCDRCLFYIIAMTNDWKINIESVNEM